MIGACIKAGVGHAIYQRRISRKSIEEEILDTERLFQFCNKLEDPARWIELQDALGALYLNYMRLYASNVQ